MDRSFIGNLNEVEIQHAKKDNHIIYAFLVGGRLTH